MKDKNDKELHAGDKVVIHCTILTNPDKHGTALLVVTDPVDLPGSKQYKQTILLSDCRQAEKVEQKLEVKEHKL